MALKVAAAVLAACLLVLVSAMASEDGPSDVVVLDASNFDDVVGKDKDVLVEFYAPWCGHCKKLAPEYDQLAAAFKRTKSVAIAKVDCDKHKDVGNRFDIKGFPTIKWFSKGSLTPEDYEGGRTKDAMLEFVNKKAGTNVAEAPSDVVVLTPANFDAVVLDKTKNVLVEFYAPWCGHCKSLAPVYDQLAFAYKADKDVVIAKLDADAQKELGEKYQVSGFPTLKWFGESNKESPETYEGARDIDGLLTYVNEKAGKFRTQDGTLTAEAGKISELDELAAKFVGATSSERDNLQRIATAAAGSVAENETKAAQQYLRVMKNIVEKGDEYVAKEVGRLDRLLSGAMSAAKIDDMTVRKNILSSFSPKLDGGVAEE